MEDIQHSLDVATRFLETVDLPKAVKSFEEEGLPLDLSRPVFDQVKEQSIVIGSQLAGFSSDVPVKLRPMISNVFLLAQLVADKKTQHAASGSKQWYDTYLETLTKVGWSVSGMSDAEQIISGSALEVHKEIIPVIVAALGPAAAAASTIVRVLEGLGNISKDQPWITLFNRKSQRATANQFQFSQTTMEGDTPVVTLVAFNLDARNAVTQVLFFKFVSNKASLSYFEEKLFANLKVLEHTQDRIFNIVLDHISSNITELEALGIS
nr:hypothetical protein [uncultured Cohaesibacter sp.]